MSVLALIWFRSMRSDSNASLIRHAAINPFDEKERRTIVRHIPAVILRQMPANH